MNITIGKYNFQGPYSSLNKLKNKPGLYAVHRLDDKQVILDLGEAAMIKDRIKTHERMKCWLRCSRTQGIAISAYYTRHWTQSSRMQTINNLRKQYSPPCGKKSDGKLFFSQE